MARTTVSGTGQPINRRQGLALALGAAAGLGGGTGAAAQGETLKVGVLKLASAGPVFLAQELGYFREAGLNTELKYFEAAQPVSVATVSGDVDVGVTGLTGGFYNLAGKGGLKIIAAQSREEKGYRLTAVIVSKKGTDAGIKDLAGLAGHSAGITQIGSTFHYTLGLIAEKNGFDIGKVRIVPLQSLPNVVSAVKGSQVDTAILPATAANPLLAAGEATLLGWTDELPWQVAAVFTSPRTIETRRPALEAFLRGYVRGAEAFHAAFLVRGPDGQPKPGPEADKAMDIIARYTGQNPTSLRASIPYIDPRGRLLVGDVYRQVRWYQSQKLVDAAVDAKAILDLSFVPGHFDVPS